MCLMGNTSLHDSETPVLDKLGREEIGIFKREREIANMLQHSIYHFLLFPNNIIYYYIIPIPLLDRMEEVHSDFHWDPFAFFYLCTI